jgi:hypothetical protein
MHINAIGYPLLLTIEVSTNTLPKNDKIKKGGVSL